MSLEDPNLSDLTPYINVSLDRHLTSHKRICFIQGWGVGVNLDKNKLYLLPVYDARPVGLNVGVYEIPEDETVGRKLKVVPYFTVGEGGIVASTDLLNLEGIPKFTWRGYMRFISARWRWDPKKVDEHVETLAKIIKLQSAVPHISNALSHMRGIIDASAELLVHDKTAKITDKHLLGFGG